MHEVSIAAEKIFEIAGQPITNSILTTVIVSLILICIGFWYSKNKKLVPSKFQSLVEFPIEMMLSLTEQIAPKNVKEFFPLIMTIFIFVLISNWFGLIPGLSGITISEQQDHEEYMVEEHPTGEEGIVNTEETEHDTTSTDNDHAPAVPLFRAATADLNTTIALALIAVFATHYFGFKHLGVKIHLKKFINFSNPINFFVGFLELVSEVSKIISFSFRLFGNIFAGEVLLIVIGSLIPLLIPVPFIGLEIFVGLIQALVFAMLTLVFSSIAVQHH